MESRLHHRPSVKTIKNIMQKLADSATSQIRELKDCKDTKLVERKVTTWGQNVISTIAETLGLNLKDKEK